MWLQIPQGFYSAVQDGKNDDWLQVRTRGKADAEYLRDWLEVEHAIEAEILEWPGRDYPYRLILAKDWWSSFLVAHAEMIDYTNFKDRVKSVNPKRASLYGRVWGVLLEIEDENPGPSRRKAWVNYGRGSSVYPAPNAALGSLFEYELERDSEEHAGFLAAAERRGIHSMTDDEFEEWMSEGGISVLDDPPPAQVAAGRRKPSRRDKGGRKKKGAR